MTATNLMVLCTCIISDVKKIKQQRCVRFVDINKPDKIRCSAPKDYKAKQCSLNLSEFIIIVIKKITTKHSMNAKKRVTNDFAHLLYSSMGKHKIAESIKELYKSTRYTLRSLRS